MTIPSGPAAATRTRPLPLKERILNAATAEFALNGYHRSSLRSIAERSQATKPMIYYHFRNKDGLYAAAILHQLEELETQLRNSLTHEGSLQERLRGFAHTYLSCFLEEFPALAVGLRELPTFPEPLFNEIVKAYNHMIIVILRQILRDGVAQGDLRPHDTENCMRAIVGILHHFIRDSGLENPAAIEAGTEQIADYYARGLLAEHAGACKATG